MTNEEAIWALVNLAKSRLEVIDGEYGCGHEYDYALSHEGCTIHAESVELHDIIAALPV